MSRQHRGEQRAKAPVTYEIPPEVVREAIVNAIAHRDYTSNGSVQVMLFADRQEPVAEVSPENAEHDGRDGEEVAGCDLVGVIGQEHPPRLEGGFDGRGMYLLTVDSATSWPSSRSSERILGAPQVGFSWAMGVPPDRQHLGFLPRLL